jgi:hypothetical protein
MPLECPEAASGPKVERRNRGVKGLIRSVKMAGSSKDSGHAVAPKIRV